MPIQLFDLGPPRVDTYTPIANLGKSFFDAYESAKKSRLEDEAGQLAQEWGKQRLGVADAAAPSPAVADVGKTTPNRSADAGTSTLPTFARPDTQQALAALKKIESSNRYHITGPTHRKYGRALGAYQIMEANLPQWAREALGREVTPEEFLANPQLQDTIAAHKFQQYVDQYGNANDAASMWLTGRPLAQAGGRRDVFGTDAPEYVRRFNAAMGNAGGQSPRVRTASLGPGLGYAPDTPSFQNVPWNGSPAMAQTLPFNPAQGQPVQPAGTYTDGGVTFRKDRSTGGAAVAEPLWGDGTRPEHYQPQQTAALPPATATDAPTGPENGAGLSPPASAVPTFARPDMIPQMPNGTGLPQQAPPQPAPAQPAPVRTAQASPPAAASGGALPASFERLNPGQQQILLRMLANPLTRAAAMTQIEALRKQDEWSYMTTPNGQLIRTSKSGRYEVVPGFDKPEDRFRMETDAQGRQWKVNERTNERTVAVDAPDQWTYQDAPNGDLIGTNAKTGKKEILNAGERDATIRQYQFAQRQGYQGSLFDFKRGMAEAARPVTTVTNNVNTGKAETKFEEQTASEQAQAFAEMAKDGRNARADLGRIRRLRSEIDKLPGGTEGRIQAMANRWGVKIGPNASSVEAAEALINQLVPQQRPAGSGTMSDRDVDLFKSSLPALGNTKKGNALILDTMEALAIYRQRQGDIAGRAMSGKITRQQAQEELNNLEDPFERFNAAIEKDPTLLNGDSEKKGLGDLKPGETLQVEPGVTIRRGR